MQLDEEGKPINPHIPQFMASAPWYLNQDQPTLKHQKNWKGQDQTNAGMSWYDRGAKVFQATTYRKGACTNCGSMSHKRKDCMERPRVKGAKYTNKNIAPDEKVEDISIEGFEAKRDRWNGFDEREWVKQAEKFERVQELRQELRKKEVLEKKFKGELGDINIEPGDLQQQAKEEDKVMSDEDEGFSEVKVRAKSAGGGESGTVRNLRIREDTAKYLLNLDVNSAYYDPKSRSMREDPNPEKDMSEKTFAGDNFVRQSGQAGFQQLNLFSVTATEKGQDVHMQATPSQAEISFKAVQERKKMLQQDNRKHVLEKYGNAAADVSEETKALQGTEAYVEYDAHGRVIKGHEIKVKSRYEEDIFPGNHSSVWGSWYSPQGEWGFACCHLTSRNAYCTGEQGKRAAEQNMNILEDNMNRYNDAVEHVQEDSKARKAVPLPPHGAALWGTDAAQNTTMDNTKLEDAIKRHDRRNIETKYQYDDRKRQYNSLEDSCNITEEDLEAYRLKRSRADDPLAAMKDLK